MLCRITRSGEGYITVHTTTRYLTRLEQCCLSESTVSLDGFESPARERKNAERFTTLAIALVPRQAAA